MDCIDLYNFWKTDEFFDVSTRNELTALDPGKTQKKLKIDFTVIWSLAQVACGESWVRKPIA